MNRIESDEASNDDTNIISDLLNSAETMQSVSTNNAGITKMQVQQKDELQIVQNSEEISAKFCDATKQNLVISLQQNNSAVDSDLLLNSTQYSDAEDLNKMNIRHVHIPYILNGELYQIQTQDGENVTVKCCHCPPDRVYRGSVRSTGNFHMHIKRRHPDLLEKLHDMKVNALLERRDRLMRNRKITHRNNRNRLNSNSMCSFKNEEKPELITSTPGSQIIMDSTPELSLMHTHKLKIKTVFQRHQMQQREAAEMKNWNKADYVVMPIGKLQTNEGTEQPINYSLKSSENHESHASIPSVSSNTNQQQQEKRIPHDSTTQASFNNINNQTAKLTTTNNDIQQNSYICENYTNNRNLSTSSISISCPSVMSSYSSSHQYEMEINQSYNSVPLHHHNLSVIKPEHLLLGPETEAIDLTMHTDSGIFSNSEDSGSVQNNDSQNNKINNSNNNSINNNRAGSQKTKNDNTTTTNDVERNGDSVNNFSPNAAKWQELLMQVENSLRDIQREMNVRNQIESNRMFLDIAKFKYLNPGFQFNW